MLRHYGMVREVAREISAAANNAFKAYVEDRMAEEPQITERILGAIEERIKNKTIESAQRSVSWQAYSLRTSSGYAAEEKRHGADFMGVLDIDLPDYEVKKGFLVQAKKSEPYDPFSLREWCRLIHQCETMLERTPDSFVFVYSRSEGIRIFPAVSVLGCMSKDIFFDLYHHSVQRFFEDHIKCFIGDQRLNSPKIRTLDALADFPVERVLHLTARMPE